MTQATCSKPSSHEFHRTGGEPRDPERSGMATDHGSRPFPDKSVRPTRRFFFVLAKAHFQSGQKSCSDFLLLRRIEIAAVERPPRHCQKFPIYLRRTLIGGSNLIHQSGNVGKGHFTGDVLCDLPQSFNMVRLREGLRKSSFRRVAPLERRHLQLVFRVCRTPDRHGTTLQEHPQIIDVPFVRRICEFFQRVDQCPVVEGDMSAFQLAAAEFLRALREEVTRVYEYRDSIHPYAFRFGSGTRRATPSPPSRFRPDSPRAVPRCNPSRRT